MGTRGKWCFEVGEAICLNTAEKMSFGLGDGKIFSDLSKSHFSDRQGEGRKKKEHVQKVLRYLA